MFAILASAVGTELWLTARQFAGVAIGDKIGQGTVTNRVKYCSLTFRRRIKSRLPFAGIIRRLPYSTRFQDKG